MKDSGSMSKMAQKIDNQGSADNLILVNERIVAAAQSIGRHPSTISLVAVSKLSPVGKIKSIIKNGQLIFGENRVQEAINKWPPLKHRNPDVRLHLIGPLQTNKVKDAMTLFDVIETIDRPKLAHAIARQRDLTQKCPDLLIQVNIGSEPQKHGIFPDRVHEFIMQCHTEFDLQLRGLMCIPPKAEDPAIHFNLLKEIGDTHSLPWLSMGMSDDFEIAVRCGATHVRVGTAIFGPRTS